MSEDFQAGEAFKEVGLTLEEIEKSIQCVKDALKEWTGYGKDVTGLLAKLNKALLEAQKLRSEANPNRHAYLGFAPGETETIGVELTLEILIEFVKGVDQRQRQVFGVSYERREAYSQRNKEGEMERNLAVIAADFCSRNRKIKKRGVGRTQAIISAEMFIQLGYELDGNIGGSFESLRKRAEKDMKQDELKKLCVNKLRDDLKAKMGYKSSIDFVTSKL